MRYSNVKYQAELAARMEVLDLALHNMPMPYVARYLLRLKNFLRAYQFGTQPHRQEMAKFAKELRRESKFHGERMKEEFMDQGGKYLSDDAEAYEAALKKATQMTEPYKARHYIIDQYMPLKTLGSISGAFKTLANSISRDTYKKVNRAYMKVMEKGEGVNLQSLVEEYQPDKLLQSRAKSVVNTSMSLLREDSRNLVERDYETYIMGWQFDAHLDTRTTEGCRSRDHEVYYKPRPDATKNETVPADSLVPRHYNCRSMLIPVPYKPDIRWVMTNEEDLGKQIRETWELRRYFE